MMEGIAGKSYEEWGYQPRSGDTVIGGGMTGTIRGISYLNGVIRCRMEWAGRVLWFTPKELIIVCLAHREEYRPRMK